MQPTADEMLLMQGLRAHCLAKGVGVDHVSSSVHALRGPVDASALAAAVTLSWENRTLLLFDAGLGAQLDPALRKETGLDRAATDFKTAAMTRNGSILSRAAGIAALLDAQSVPAVFFKGPLQQQQVSGAPFLRPAGDLDILVPKRAFGAAIRALRAEGLRTRGERTLCWDVFLGESHLTVPGVPWTVDLHHCLQQPGMPLPRRLAAFLEARAVIGVHGRQFPVVNADHAALVAAMNLAKALFQQGRAAPCACDLMVALGGGADPDRVRRLEALGRAQGLCGTIALCLRMLRAVFGGDLRERKGRAGEPLPKVSDGALARMVLGPRRLPDPPRRRAISAASCAGDPGARLRVGAWYLGSEVARLMSEGRGRRKALPDQSRPTA